MSKNKSLIVSIIALIFSIYFSINQINSKRKSKDENNRSSAIKSIKELTLEMISAQQSMFSQQPVVGHPNNSQINTLYQIKQDLHFEELLALAKQYEKLVHPDIFSFIGTEYFIRQDFFFAKEYYLKHLRYTITTRDKIQANRNLARMYSINEISKVNNTDSSTFYWNQCLIEATKLNGELKDDIKGQTYISWAEQEFYNGNITKKDSLLENARKIYNSMPNISFNKLKGYDLIKSLEFQISNQYNPNPNNVHDVPMHEFRVAK